MKTIFDFRPAEIIDLGDGTYLENSNIEELTDDETGATQWRADSVRKEWPKVPEVPIEVYAWRLRLATQMGGLKTTIDALLNSLPEPDKTIALEAWNSGVTIRRDSPLIASLATQLGLTKEQVDEYFIQANSIEI
jgi:hypothetical protein